MHSRIYAAVIAMALCAEVGAEAIPDIASTKHNLSASSTSGTRAVSEDEICVFCHTPHGATSFPGSPLWNRQLSNQTYTVYTSSSLDAEDIMGQLDQPAGSSKLCLSCHDGTLAIGTVNVLNGNLGATIGMTGVAADGSMPAGGGTDTGSTRDLGVSLTNDHPIALDYDAALASADTELVDPVTAAHIGVRAPGFRPPVPLEATGTGGAAQIQCATCHDPHVRGPDPAESIKFLRLQRFQSSAPVGGQFNEDIDTLCLACHDKRAYASSAHASVAVADETYTAAGAAVREFPVGTAVWQASCLNCHDPHTVHGARRLAREGTDGLGTPKSGGASAIEETCYQCHGITPVVTNATGAVKDVQSHFALSVRMPITSLDQAAGAETHDVTDADLSEDASLLGKPNLANRHAECTDCHNPHRLVRNGRFNSAGLGQSAHEHTAPHTNLAPGSLRGAWGVEPLYGAANFPSLPTGYLVKRGDGGDGASTLVTSAWVTREYQVCFKCHSDYGYFDNNVFPTGSRPNLGTSGGGTASGTNGLTQFTNQVVEFHAPTTHTGNASTIDSGAGSAFGINNHRSWHPVVGPTGRTTALRSASANAWLAPFATAIGSQTMLCSDCHGANTAVTTVVPTGTQPWGPHGSSHPFLLKGTWSSATGGATRDVPATDPNNGLCFKCHDYRTYADRNGNGRASGFGGDRDANLHAFHVDRIGRIRCSWCHTTVPHGFKNKGLLVNLNDVGAEAGLPSGTEISVGANAVVFDREPYYRNAKLKIVTFATSGQWEDTNCGSAGAALPGNNTLVGKDWMGDVCSNPP